MTVARAGLRLGWPTARDGRVWWTEDRPDEGGRTTIMRLAADGVRRELLPAPWNARTRVHEYGGRPYAITPDGDVIFANHADQRLYRLGTGDPTPITPEGDGSRYADLLVHDGQVWCVRERHAEDGKITRAVVAIPLDGGQAREWATGCDFYASPALSPDGRHLAYVCWNHPRMPWNGTELRVTRLSDGAYWTVAGGPSESVLAPQWKDDSRLYLVSDRSGWWNLDEIGLDGTARRPLHPAEEEFAAPPWQLGGAPYLVLGDGRLAVLHGRGDLRLGLLDPDTGALRDLDVPWSGWQAALAADGGSPAADGGSLSPDGGSLGADGGSLVGVGYAPTVPTSVVRVSVETGQTETLSAGLDELPDTVPLPLPRAIRSHGDVHGYLYPPAAGQEPDDDRPPPYVIFVHGGPTSHARTELDLEKVFLTSRGIGVLDLNYGGSTGYGRAYRDRLKGEWGVVDVADAVAAARWLAEDGLADPARIAIRGGSAGGWTVMAACCRSDVFAGGVSYFGVSALGPLVAHTHDFESRYVEWLVGPEDPQVYASREPLALVDGVSCPMLLLQGLDDPVVPPAQSAAFADALAERGVPCTYLAFDGESHGFRRTETRAAALAAELAFYQQLFG
ncbi:S9 family peptidase [Nonomuraea antri]|uniref:S9 family peptidase n=1 Tax=Nonomuraea antri TaxID=2730852 RepID=UPI001F2493E8|nr:prolyl oligopeptidase family serine peptidase [Nonomuraea antri]